MKSPSLHRRIERTWLEIDGAALRRNLAALRRRAGGASILAMVKANAYGHGMVPVAREALAAGAFGLGVADLDELRALRAAKIAAPVLLCSAALPEEYGEIVRLRGWPTLSTLAEARLLDAAAKKAGVRAQAHFKVDTGMGRLGLPPAGAAEALRQILRLKNVSIVAAYSHFAGADSDPAFTRRQAARFAAWRKAFPALPWHLANSAALLGVPASAKGSRFVRPGLALYGLPPHPVDSRLLRPVLSWKARVTLVRPMPKGTTVSYGATYRLPKPQLLAVVSAGYGDGYPRSLSNGAEVLVGGRRCPVRGRVTMDEIVVDASRVREAKPGDEVVLLGRQGKEEITADELAHLAGTISYEIVTRLPERLPRLFV